MPESKRISWIVFVAAGILTAFCVFFQTSDAWQEMQVSVKMTVSIVYAIGVTIVAGIISGVVLSRVDRKPDEDDGFVTVKRNADMGNDYWKSFLAQTDRCGETLWFVGKSHWAWLDPGRPFRRKLIESVTARIEKFKGNAASGQGEIVTIVKDRNAANAWLELANAVIRDGPVHIAEAVPRIMNIGYIDETHIKYSIVAHATRLTVTSYLSAGLSDESPTFELEVTSGVADLYFRDLQEIRDGDGERTVTWVYGPRVPPPTSNPDAPEENLN